MGFNSAFKVLSISSAAAGSAAAVVVVQ